MKTIRTALLAGLTLAVASMTANAAAAAPAECNLPALNQAQRDIVAKADEGVDALRQHVWRTRAIHQYEIHEAADFAAARRTAERKCIEAMRNEVPTVAKATN
jgi:hypothetical protein